MLSPKKMSYSSVIRVSRPNYRLFFEMQKEAAKEAKVWWKLATETKRVLGVSS